MNITIFYFSANTFAMQHKRKTISGNDVLEAMKEMDFERFVEPLKQALEGMYCRRKSSCGKSLKEPNGEKITLNKYTQYLS